MTMVPMGGPPALPPTTLQQLIAALSQPRAIGPGGAGVSGGRALGPGSIPLGPIGSSGSAQAMGNAASRMAAQAAGTGTAGGATAANIGGVGAGAAGVGGLGAAVSGLRNAPGYLARNPRALLKGAGRGGAAGIATGLVADPIIEAAVPGSNSRLEQTLQGAATGAGIGAGIGSVVPVVGTGVVAGLGGLIGGGIGYLTAGKDKKSATNDYDKFYALTNRAQLDSETTDRILRQFDAEYAFAETDAERKQAYLNGRANVLTAIASPVQQQQPRMTAQDILALQMAASNFLEPHARDLEAQGTADAAILNELASSLPTPALQASTRIQAQNRLGNNRGLAAAYRAQAQLLPSTYAIQQEQAYRNQQAQQAIAQMNSGQATSLQQLLGS